MRHRWIGWIGLLLCCASSALAATDERHTLIQEDIGLVHPFEVEGCQPVYTQVNLSCVITSIGSAVRSLMLPVGTWTISSNLTIPENITSYLPAGATISVSLGATLTINGGFRCDATEDCFSLGAGSYVFGPQSLGLRPLGGDQLQVIVGGVARLTVQASGRVDVGSYLHAGPLTFTQLSALTASDGDMGVCSNCGLATNADNTCNGEGGGALFVRLSGAWRCFSTQDTESGGEGGGGTPDDNSVTSAKIVNGAILNEDINASAAIALSKLATDPLARANHTGTQTASTISDFDTQVHTSRLDQMTTPTSSVAMGTQKITGLGTPTDATDASTKAYVDTHIDDTTAAHAASAISFTPTGTISSTNVEAAIIEVAAEAAGGVAAGGSDTHVQYNDAGVLGGDAGLTYNETTDTLTAGAFVGPLTGNVTGNASTATALAANGADCSAGSAPLGVDASGAVVDCFDVATQGELNAHVNNPTGAHAASAISFSAGGTVSGTDLQTAVAEVASEASTVTSAEITDGEIVNADINASAAIAETKLALNFPTHVNVVMGQETPQILAASDDIAVTATLTKRLTVPIAGSGGPVTLTSTPQISAGSDTQIILVYGTSETETVTIVNGAGVMLCGSGTDAYIISSAQSAEFQYSTGDALWRQLNCKETVDGEIPVSTPIETAFTVSETGHITNSNPDKFFGICNDLNPLECYGFQWQMGILHIVRPTGEMSTILDDNSPMTVRSNVGTVLAQIENDGKLTGTAFPVFACNTFENVTGSFDNLLFMRWPFAVTVTGIDAVYQGSAPTLAATFTLADGDGNALTISGSSPTVVARTAIPDTAAVTDDSASQLSVNETLLISVGNTPNPLTDTYQVCVHGKRR